MTDYRVSSTQIEDIHTGANFGPNETAVGFNPDDPYDAAKLEEGRFVAIAESVAETPDPTPDAAKLAGELDVDLGKVAGSGENGRVTKADVEKAHKDQEAAR